MWRCALLTGGHVVSLAGSLRTELEGLIPTYGDLVAIAHDMPSWGAGGDIVAWDADTHTATLSEPVQFTDGQPHTPHVMALRRRDGGVSGPHAEIGRASCRERVCQYV